VEFTYTIAQRFERQGATCAAMGSRFYGALCSHAARAYETDLPIRALLDRHAHRSRLALRFLGAAHFRALRNSAAAIAAHFPSTGGDGDAAAGWDAIRDDVLANDAAYGDLLARPVQTNEVARALPILAAMLFIADATHLPLRIFEIGSSAGLLLNFDLYRYSGTQWVWGDPFSPLHLRNRTASGRPQNLNADLVVRERRGCDLHPLNVRNDSDADTLLSFVWPDQHERLDRLHAAIDIGRGHPVVVDPADGVDWIARVALPKPQHATVAMHTVITEHMPPQTREELRSEMRELGKAATPDAPFAWARMELGPRAYETTVTLWPAERDRILARSDGHAQDLEWSAPTA
jgi:hypothetical protein